MAISLVALLLALAFGSLRVATQSSRSGEALISRSEQVRTVQAFLRRQLGQMLPLPYDTEDSGALKRFEVDRRNIQFVAPMPGYLSRGGAHVQRLSLVSGRNGLRLEFQHAQLNGFDPDDPFKNARDPVVLLDGLDDAQFRFRRIEDDGKLGDWSDDWPDPQRMPLMVGLDIELPREDRRHWPQFEVAVLTSAGAIGPGLSVIPNAMDFGPTPSPDRARQ